MTRIKSVTVLLLLILMTGGVVVAPQLLNKQNEDVLLNKTIYWDYNTPSSINITSKQVAQLYYNRMINFNSYYSMSFNEETGDTAKIKEEVISVLDIVFGENHSISENIKAIVLESSLYCTRSSVLTKVDNQPVALNFVEVVGKGDNGSLSLIYEEKTKTLIWLSSSPLIKKIDTKTEGKNYFNELYSAIKAYYVEQLELFEECIFYSGDTYSISENDEGSYSMNAYLEFGISTYDVEEKEIDERMY